MRQLQSALGGAATQTAVRSADLATVEEAVGCCNYKRTKVTQRHVIITPIIDHLSYISARLTPFQLEPCTPEP
jgi:hypothetical protein